MHSYSQNWWEKGWNKMSKLNSKRFSDLKSPACMAMMLGRFVAPNRPEGELPLSQTDSGLQAPLIGSQ